MLKSEYKVVGVMSGTSLDGLDLSYVNFKLDNNIWSFDIINSSTISYDDYWFRKLSKLTCLSTSELIKVDEIYTKFLAHSINDFLSIHHINELDAVCSHGHTALHNPTEGYTLQIGNKKSLSKILNTKVVCDFRAQDVKLGGQGAPLVPIGDQLLFYNYDFCLNLGGFANISTNNKNKRIAYDICPVNIVLNRYSRKIGFEYDENGAIASQGIIQQRLLKELNELGFYKMKPPKSLGLEWVEKKVFPLIDCYNLKTHDVLRTFVEHIAFQISKQLKGKSSVLITGGGAYNSFLIERLRLHSNAIISIPNKELIEYKEALIFGLLGVLRLRNEVNCLSSVTGASIDHSSGLVFDP